MAADDLRAWLRDRRPWHFVAAAAILAVLAVATHAWLTPPFDDRAWRQAVTAKDYDQLERQGRRLDRDPAAVTGLRRDEVRKLLGPPDSVEKRRHLWIWNIGGINDTLGPGDDGYLFVQFDGPSGVARQVVVNSGFETEP